MSKLGWLDGTEPIGVKPGNNGCGGAGVVWVGTAAVLASVDDDVARREVENRA